MGSSVSLRQRSRIARSDQSEAETSQGFRIEMEGNATALDPNEITGSTSHVKFMLGWVNYHLAKVDMKAVDLRDDMRDGFLLILLIQIITKENLKDYRPRLAREMKIDNRDWIDENQGIINAWLRKSMGAGKAEETEPHKDSLDSILWHLLMLSVKRPSYEPGCDHFGLSRELFKSIDCPFIFEGFNLENLGPEVLIRSSIIIDKMDSIKNGDKESKIRKWIPPPQRFKTVTPLDIRIADQGVLRVFLSSTFRDMQYERDHFFQHGAVELKQFAKNKGLELVFIDLRWGLTADDSRGGWVVIRCCDSIKKCPYFVCSLGARYGWTPNQTVPEEWHPETNIRFPFVSTLPSLSVTEYEIQFGALIEKPACSRVFFYFRDQDFALKHAKNESERVLFQSENQAMELKQGDLKAKIQRQYTTFIYQGAKEFSDMLTSHLMFSIEQDFGKREVREPEDQAQYQFMQHRLAGFEGRTELLNLIKQKVGNQLKTANQKITILAAQSGIGKSSLMAAAVRELNSLQKKEMKILYHFVGCTSLSNYVESISVRFWKAISAIYEDGTNDLIGKSESEFQSKGIGGMMKFISEQSSNNSIVLLIDAVNQLHPSQDTPAPHLLTWLPKVSSKNCAIVASTIDTHETCQVAREHHLDIIPVGQLDISEIEQAAVSYLTRYDKTLAESQKILILERKQQTGHPLFLRLVLEEIRVFGVYEQLDQELLKLINMNGVIQLYDLIITRWQSKYNHKDALIVQHAMKVLFVSRIGLSEGELDRYIQTCVGVKFSLSEWKSFFFTLAESLFVRNGRYMYFHQLLLQTVDAYFFESRDIVVETHKDYGMWLLGQYADILDAEDELVAEVCFQLLMGECFDALVEYLKKENVVESMLRSRYRYEFFNCWRIINSKGITNYKDAYQSLAKSLTKVGDMLIEFFLEAFENSFLVTIIPQRIAKRATEESKASDYLRLGKAFKNMQNWKESIKYFLKSLDIKEHASTESDEEKAAIFSEIGFVHQKENKLKEAISQFQKSLDIRKKLFGDYNMKVATSYDRFGSVFIQQSRYEEALKLFTLSMEIRLKNVGPDHPSVSMSYVNIGHVYMAEKKYKEALENYEKAKDIVVKSFGDKHPSVASSMQHIASVYEAQDKFTDAIDMLKESISLSIKSLGENHPDVVSAYERLGAIYRRIKEHQQALTAFAKTLDIKKRTLGNVHPDVASAYENVGLQNYILGRSDQVSEFFHEASKIRKLTVTQPSLNDGTICFQIAELLETLSFTEASLCLYKRVVSIYEEDEKYTNVVIWKAVNKVEKLFSALSLHSEAAEYFGYLKTLFTDKIGWAHKRTLVLCEYLSAHSRPFEAMKEPAEFTSVKDFIKQNIPDTQLSVEWNRKEIAAYLFAIVYKSRESESISQQAATSISVLNFMEISFAGMDLSRIQIPHANLEAAILDGADLSGANLEGVNLSNASLAGCNFSGSNMKGSTFGIPHPVLQGHTDWTSSVCELTGPSGEKWLASASNDHTVRIWDAASGKQLKVMEGHFNRVNIVCCAPGPNGESWVASAGRDNIIRLWDASTGNQIKTFQGHTDWITCVYAISGPNEEYWLISCGYDKIVCVWDLLTGDLVMKLEGHTWHVFYVTKLSGPKGEFWLASGSRDKTIRIWDLSTGLCIRVLEGHTDAVWGICGVKGQRRESFLASASADYSVRLWDTSNWSLVKVFKGHSNIVYRVCYTQNTNGEELLVSSSYDGTIRLWDIANGVEIYRITKHTGSVNGLNMCKSPDGGVWILSAGDDRLLMISDPDATESNYEDKDKVVYTQGKSIVSLTESGKVSMSHDNAKTEGVFVEKSGKRFLEGGDIVARNTENLSKFNRDVLLSHGACTFDSHFVAYCENHGATLFQTQMMVQCYENGLGVEKNPAKAALWKQRLESNS